MSLGGVLHPDGVSLGGVLHPEVLHPDGLAQRRMLAGICSCCCARWQLESKVHSLTPLPPLPPSCPPTCSLLEVVHPLGLQAIRLAAVRGLARDFLATEWQDPSEFRGCGRFVADSWRIFCRGGSGGQQGVSLQGVDDKNLQRYLRWLAHGQQHEEHEGGTPGQRERAVGGRKRKAVAAAKAGTLRSGKRRGPAAGGGGGRSRAPAGGRRLTRAAAAAAGAGAGRATGGRRG